MTNSRPNPYVGPRAFQPDESFSCDLASRNFTLAEWNEWFPQEPYHVTCPQWASGQP
jgi:hypothetical protein